jgi:hypothetical protein
MSSKWKSRAEEVKYSELELEKLSSSRLPDFIGYSCFQSLQLD